MVEKAKGRKEEVVTREYTINLHKHLNGCTKEVVCLIGNVTHSLMENDVENEFNNHTEQQHQQDEIEDQEDEEVSTSLDSEIGDVFDSLDLKDEDVGYSFSPIRSAPILTVATTIIT
ncbi:hypothetical protein LR48_Vigan03g056500 [Vigna angularis]|uniref:Uncharacterized protein n=1 Tax=Phaseolus angularis TaxID=3914 RepID=A0A0L9U447_PHAAN|nr:hypothetical protein LR48_Vigan03g056500 [Vigna angularis]